MNEEYRIGIISAMPIELALFEELVLSKTGWIKRGINEYYNKACGIFAKTLITGVGKVNAAYQTADFIADFCPDTVINVGYAGGLANGAHKGDIIIGSDFAQADFKPLRKENLPMYSKSTDGLKNILEKFAIALDFSVFSGLVATGDFFLHTSAEKQAVRDMYPNAVAFDMESAAIARVCNVKNVDFASLRTLSDLADDNAVKDVEANREGMDNRIPYEERPVRIVVEALEELRSLKI